MDSVHVFVEREICIEIFIYKRRLYTWISPDVNTKIRLIILFAAEKGEALHSQQKQD